MFKHFCDCCKTELDMSGPKVALDEQGIPKRIVTEKFDPIQNKMVEFSTVEMVENPKEQIVVQLNLNNHDTIYREFCLECYKKFSAQVKEFWNFLYAIGNS